MLERLFVLIFAAPILLTSTSCSRPSQPYQDCTYEAYWQYRATLGELQPEWVEFWTPFLQGPNPVAAARTDDYGQYQTTEDGFLRELSVRLKRKSDTKEELIRVVELGSSMLERVCSLPPPSGPFPLPQNSSFERVLTPQGRNAAPLETASKKTVAQCLLIQAALADDPDDAAIALRAMDNVIRGLLIGHSKSELIRALSLEQLKWEFLLAGLHHHPNKFRGIVESSVPIVDRSDIAIMFREFQRRIMVYDVRLPYASGYTEDEKPITNSKALTVLNDYYESAALAASDGCQPLPGIRIENAKLDKDLKNVVSFDFALKEPRRWCGLQDLIAVTKALGKGDSPMVETRVLEIQIVSHNPLRVIARARGAEPVQLWPPQSVLAKGLLSVIDRG